MKGVWMIIPMIIYLGIMLYIAYIANRKSADTEGNGFINEYFIGGRSLGGFVLAMTLIATYTSARSFIGGPGVAYEKGLGWVLLAMIQVPTAFLTLGVLGKKFAIVSRRIDAVTISDFIRARYKNETVVIITSLALVIFFIASMIAQFVGGARLFQSITGYSYEIGLIIFGVTVIVYTTIGGFKAVAITDAIQGVMMLIATVLLFVAVVMKGGGIENIIDTIKVTNPAMLTPFGADQSITQPFILSYWILVGFAVLGLPQTSVRCMGFKDSKSLHNAMIIGTFVVGFLLLGMHLVGFLGAGIMPGIEVGDLAIPTITIAILPPVLAGIFIAGPLAAIMSTVDSMLILASATIIKDLIENSYIKVNIDNKGIKRISLILTGIIGIIVFMLALNPPDLLVWINLFAFGGLEAAFLWPTILGLYWRKANSSGALWSSIIGVLAYFAISIFKISPMGINPIVPTIIIALLAFLVGNYFGNENDENTIKLFFE